MDSGAKQKVVYKPKAIAGINAIAKNIAEEGYPETSKKFADRLYDFGDSLSFLPNKYKLCPHSKLAKRNMRCAVFQKYYIFVHKVENDELVIYNVIHARTNPKSFAA